jgi:hypothetical protein
LFQVLYPPAICWMICLISDSLPICHWLIVGSSWSWGCQCQLQWPHLLRYHESIPQCDQLNQSRFVLNAPMFSCWSQWHDATIHLRMSCLHEWQKVTDQTIKMHLECDHVIAKVHIKNSLEHE